MNLPYYKRLDGVRGLAAIMVMFFHFFQGSPINGNTIANVIQKASVFGQTGVTLFFVLSGFLITRILIATKAKPNFFKIFYLRRSFRIFPLYYLFLIISFVLIPILSSSQFPEIKSQWYFWVYLQNIAMTFNWPCSGPGHFWSLAVEEQFYLVWPLLIYFLNQRYLKISVYFIILISIVARYLLVSNGYGSFFFTLSNTDALVMGALLAKIEQENSLRLDMHNKYVLLLGLSFIPTIALWLFTGGKGLDIIQIVKLSLLALVYFSSLAVVITAPATSLINKLFTHPIFQYSGKISYGLYVFHPLCYGLAEVYLKGLPIACLLIVCFASAYLISSISFYAFEKPILKLKNRFEY